MRRLFLPALLLAVWILPPLAAQGQIWRMAEAACTPPGLSFTEGWNASQACTPGGASGCNYTWQVGSGAGGTLAASPAHGSGWCGHSLQMVLSTSSQNWQYTALPETIPAGATGDVWIRFDVKSQGLSPYDNVQFFGIADQTNSAAEFPFNLYWDNYGGALCIAAQGSTTSSCLTVSTGVSHTLQIHAAAGSAKSYISLDGGTHATFTEKSQAAKYATIGNGSGETDAMTYYVGSVTMSFPGVANCAPGTYPWAFLNFSGVASGAVPTTTTLTSSTVGGGGSWSENGTISQMTASTASLAGLRTAIDVCGNWISGGSANNSLQYATSKSGQYLSYSFTNTSGTAIANFFFRTTLPAKDSNYYDIFTIEDAGAHNENDLSLHGNGSTLQFWLENYTGSDQGPAISFTSGDVLYISMVYHATGKHTISIWDVTQGWQFLGTISAATTGNYPPGVIDVGDAGAEPQTSGYAWWYQNVVMDYTGNGWTGP